MEKNVLSNVSSSDTTELFAAMLQAESGARDAPPNSRLLIYEWSALANAYFRPINVSIVSPRTTISVRRFSVRPSGVSLLATGLLYA